VQYYSLEDIFTSITKDKQGDPKGYFTYHGLAFRLPLITNGGWTYQKIYQALEKWKQESKIEEIELGKYKPVG
jgi:hypothetical protein